VTRKWNLLNILFFAALLDEGNLCANYKTAATSVRKKAKINE
jgi:hypothetical protein